MMESSENDLGGIARGLAVTARARGQVRGAGSWNKWRGPASSRGGAVYAAKARQLFACARARRDTVTRLGNPALFFFMSSWECWGETATRQKLPPVSMTGGSGRASVDRREDVRGFPMRNR